MNTMTFDAQAALGFLRAQTAIINTTVYKMQYPDLDVGRLVHVDDSMPEFATSVITYTSESVGRADWYTAQAKDVPKADVMMGSVETRVHTGAVGYGYNAEEIGQAMLMGINLTADKAAAARQAYREFLWRVALVGDTTKGLSGLVNQPAAVTGLAPADGTGGVTTWFNAGGALTKTPQQIVRDINGVLTGIFTGSNTVEMADTLLLPYSTLSLLGATPMSDTNSETVLSYLTKNNIYVQQRGGTLTIRGEIGLDTAGAGGTKRMVAYANRQDVVKLHLPMPHKFSAVWQDGPYHFQVPGMFRTGGVEVMRPGAFRYLDGI